MLKVTMLSLTLSLEWRAGMYSYTLRVASGRGNDTSRMGKHPWAKNVRGTIMHVELP